MTQVSWMHGAPRAAVMMGAVSACVAVAATLVAGTQARRSAAYGRRLRELEQMLEESRIEMLRTQLDPHFLFNALNAISAHVERAPRTARWMIEQLGDLLRLSLELTRRHEVTLREELAIADRYLALQKVRFDDRVDVIVDVEPGALTALVPTFVLQPLLENAIRHGLARHSTPGLIEIQAWSANEVLHVQVADNGAGLPVGWTPGVGLANTQERLRRLYHDDQSVRIEPRPEGGTSVVLTLPYRSHPPAIG